MCLLKQDLFKNRKITYLLILPLKPETLSLSHWNDKRKTRDSRSSGKFRVATMRNSQTLPMYCGSKNNLYIYLLQKGRENVEKNQA